MHAAQADVAGWGTGAPQWPATIVSDMLGDQTGGQVADTGSSASTWPVTQVNDHDRDNRALEGGPDEQLRRCFSLRVPVVFFNVLYYAA